MATTEQRPVAAPPSRVRRALDVVDDRLGIKALQYPVPAHANRLAWSLGGLTAVALVILIGTGVILTQYYNPVPEAAHESVRQIVRDVAVGRITRGVHFWAAQAMYVLAALHLLRVIFTGSYKKPREGSYLIGVGMFALVIGAIFTGTVLKWDQEGFEALDHYLETARLLGGVGSWLTSEFSPHVPLLVRLYGAHVAIIPGLLVGLLVAHGMLVKRHGISPDPSPQHAPREPRAPFTHHLRRLGAFGLVLVGSLVALAALFPPKLGPTPVEGIEVTKPPWMFWWVFTLENWFGVKAILWGAIGLFALLSVLPFLDHNSERRWHRRPVVMALTAAVVLAFVVLSILASITTAAEHLG